MAFEGKILRIKDCKVTFKDANGVKTNVPAGQIFYIQFEDPTDKVYKAYLSLQDTDPDKCLKGQTDAELYHGKVFGHVVLGILFGPFAVIGAALANPSPESGARTYLLSKNKEIFSDPNYLMCYKRKARSRNTVHTLIGWGTWIVSVVVVSSMVSTTGY